MVRLAVFLIIIAFSRKEFVKRDRVKHIRL